MHDAVAGGCTHSSCMVGQALKRGVELTIKSAEIFALFLFQTNIKIVSFPTLSIVACELIWLLWIELNTSHLKSLARYIYYLIIVPLNVRFEWMDRRSERETS